LSAEPEDAAGRARGAGLRVEQVSAGYSREPVVHGVDLHVDPGEVVSVVGPNGSGKSTLLKAVAGELAVLTGRVLLDSTDITNLPAEDVARVGVGYVPQVDDVFLPLTVRENLDLGGYLLPSREIPARMDAALARFPRLAGMLNRRAGKLSGGERKMLALARALMTRPRLFVLDEPTANLAPAVAAELLQLHVAQLAAGGTSVLIVEQRARAVLEISHRTYVLGGGRLLLHATPAELAGRPEFVEAFLGGRPGASPLAERPATAELGP
jgi:branched-chain amino acid transport system ATP-binding protein